MSSHHAIVLATPVALLDWGHHVCDGVGEAAGLGSLHKIVIWGMD